MIEFEGRVTAREVAARALRSLRGAFAAMPFLFLLTLVLGAALGVAMYGVVPLRDALAAPKFEDFSTAVIARHLGAYFAGIAIWSVIVAPLAVAIHRFILLDERRAGFPYARAATCNFLYWLAGLLLAVMAARAFCLLLGAVSFVRTLSEFAVNAGALIVGLQIALIFPGIAIGVPAASVEKRLDTGFRMAEGKFLLLLRTIFLTQLPLTILRVVLTKIAVGRMPEAIPGEPPPLLPDPTVLQLAAAGAAGAASILAIALLAATLSWLYAARRREI